MSFLYLTQEEVTQAGPPMAAIIEALDVMFRDKGAGRCELPVKTGVHPGGGDNYIHAMPGHIPGTRTAGLKWVSGYPGNRARGLPYNAGLLVLNDYDTGLPRALMDCAWITTMRTAAASAVAARHLARPDSRVLGVLGCGVQGRSNAEALKVLFPIDTIRAYDPNPATAAAYAAEMESALGVAVEPVDRPRAAVAGCDLVCTAGPILAEPDRVIEPGWLEPGAFATLIDFDCMWQAEALAEADHFVTDDVPHLRAFQQMGYMPDIPEPTADLGQLVTGQAPGRRGPGERAIALNIGMALDDLAVAPLIEAKAREMGLGRELPL